PFTNPTASASAKAAAIPPQRGHLSSDESSVMVMPLAAIIDPTERSNSPAIMSSETAAARMPSSEAISRYVAAPAFVKKPDPPATSEKNTQTATAPKAAPSSGRL